MAKAIDLSRLSLHEAHRRLAFWRMQRQFLSDPADDQMRPASPTDVVRELGCVQAENLQQSMWAVGCRTSTPDGAAFREAYERGDIVRTHVLRPTWHYAAVEDIRWLIAATRPRIAPSIDSLRRDGGPDDAALSRAYTVIAEVLQGRSLTRDELGAALAERGLAGAGLPFLRTLERAELDSLVISGPLRGDVITYALMDERVAPADIPARQDLLAALAWRYLWRHGPATVGDLKYWASLTLTDARAAVAANADRLASLTLDGRTFYYPADTEPALDRPAAPRAHLLQILDEYFRGYQDSRDVLDIERLVPKGRETAIGMLIIDGQLAGFFKRALTTGRDPRVIFDLETLRGLDSAERVEIEQAASRYATYLGVNPVVRVN